MKNHRGLNISTVLKTLKKKNKLFSVLLFLILTGTLALSSVPVHASESVLPPQAFVTPNVEVTGNGDYTYSFHLTIVGEYDHFYWERYSNGSWIAQGNSDNLFNWTWTYDGTERQMRVVVFYYSGNQLTQTYSNVVYIYNEDNVDVPQIMRFTDFANLLLNKFLEWFDIALDFMINNPIVFIGLAMTLIIIAIGTLRHLIGGSNEKEICSI